MTQKEFDDFIFSRLYAATHYLVMESGYVGSMVKLRDYLSSKEEYQGKLTEDNFRIFNEGNNLVPTITLIRREFLPSDIVAVFFDSMGLKNEAQTIRKIPTVNVIVVAASNDGMIKLAYEGMVMTFNKWVGDNRNSKN